MTWSGTTGKAVDVLSTQSTKEPDVVNGISESMDARDKMRSDDG